MGSYVPTTAAEREEMLAAIGVDSLEGLYKAVPQEMLLPDGGLNIPDGLSELEVREAVTAMAEKNKVFKTVLRGAGAYRLHPVGRQVCHLPRRAAHLLHPLSG